MIPDLSMQRRLPLNTLAIALLSSLAAAGEPVVDEVLVTGTRTERDAARVPNSVHRLSGAELAAMPRTLPEALQAVPGVMVQKTSHGQGSPYLRGFTGFRTLFLIDGIRLNNSAFRDGPNQYWNTVDPLSLDSVEVVQGAASALYGSDAIGGTVHALTRGPRRIDDAGLWTGRALLRVATAERSRIARIEAGARTGRGVAGHVGLSLKRFGELRAGRDVGRLPDTDYDEVDADLKLRWWPSDPAEITLAHQTVRHDDVWRTHRTRSGVPWEGTSVGDEKRRVLDQERRLTYLRLDLRDLEWTFAERLSAALSYHVQEENRLRVRADDRSDRQGFEVRTMGAFAQLTVQSRIGALTYGLELYHDDVDSFRADFAADGSLRSRGIQGPVADNATYDTFGLFLQSEAALSSLELIAGLRYEYASADADDVLDPVGGTRISVSERWDALVGSLRVLLPIDRDDRLQLFGGVSQGFRTPNLSDLTRLDSARSNEIETPARSLDAERFYSLELGLRARTPELLVQLAYFHTEIDDLIVRTPTGRLLDGEREVTKRNSGSGRVQGVEISARYKLGGGLAAFGSFAWLDGEVETFPTSEPREVRETIDREMPPAGRLGLRWEDASERWWLEAIALFARHQDDLSTRDRSDTSRIPPRGTPGYELVDLRAGWKLPSGVQVTAALENLTNSDYRIHGSGQNGPGRNLVLGVEWSF